MASERLRRIIKQPRVSARRKRRSVDGGDSPSSSDSSLNSRHKRHGIDDNRRRADRSASRERNSGRGRPRGNGENDPGDGQGDVDRQGERFKVTDGGKAAVKQSTRVAVDG